MLTIAGGILLAAFLLGTELGQVLLGAALAIVFWGAVGLGVYALFQ